MTQREAQRRRMRVVVVGGGIAGAEALLALHELATDRVSLTLVSANDELVLPALAVAAPFSLARAQRYPLRDLLAHVNANLVPGSLAGVDDHAREIRLTDGQTLAFDSLVIATGAQAVARIQPATTWWPGGDAQEFGGLLRDLEEGYSKRVAFVIPPGPIWPLPLYELALMTAREVWSMGIDDVQLTVITPEPVPLAVFGTTAAAAIREELDRVGIGLETATVARVKPGHPLEVVLQPTIHRLEVDRVIALPGIQGHAIPGTTHNQAGFILVGPNGQMRDSDNVWAAGDAIAYPIKFGGLASQQADAVAADIAARVTGTAPPAPAGLKLQGVLMTGAAPRGLGDAPQASPSEHRPVWRPETKVFGKYLTPYLHDPEQTDAAGDASQAVIVEQPLPGPERGDTETLHAT
jgi:sulfide:quinone oxidoreductase